MSDDGEQYTKIAEQQYEENGEERLCTFEPVTTRYVKLVITDFLIWNNNHAIKSVTAGEFNFYRPYAMLKSSVYVLRTARSATSQKARRWISC